MTAMPRPGWGSARGVGFAGAIAGMAAAKLTGRPAIWQRLCLLNSSGGACLGTQLASDNLMEQAASLERQAVPALNAKAIVLYLSGIGRTCHRSRHGRGFRE